MEIYHSLYFLGSLMGKQFILSISVVNAKLVLHVESNIIDDSIEKMKYHGEYYFSSSICAIMRFNAIIYNIRSFKSIPSREKNPKCIPTIWETRIFFQNEMLIVSLVWRDHVICSFNLDFVVPNVPCKYKKQILVKQKSLKELQVVDQVEPKNDPFLSFPFESSKLKVFENFIYYLTTTKYDHLLSIFHLDDDISVCQILDSKNFEMLSSFPIFDMILFNFVSFDKSKDILYLVNQFSGHLCSFDINSGTQLQRKEFAFDPQTLLSFSISNDGTMIACGVEGFLYILSSSNFTPLYIVKTCGNVFSSCFSTFDNEIYFGEGNNLFCFNFATRNMQLISESCHLDDITFITCHGDFIFSCSDDHSVNQTRNFKLIKTFSVPGSVKFCLIVDSYLLIPCLNQIYIFEWKLDGEFLTSFSSRNPSMISHCAVLREKLFLCSGFKSVEVFYN